MMEKTGVKGRPRLNMYQPAVFCVRLQGELGESWADYFEVQCLSVEADAQGRAVTILTTGPVDQAGLIGILNHVNMLGLPLLSVECLSADCQE